MLAQICLRGLSGHLPDVFREIGLESQIRVDLEHGYVAIRILGTDNRDIGALGEELFE